jgi:transposase-like protein
MREAEACTERGALGALLRREGLYSSHLAAWRAALGRGELGSGEPKRPGAKPKAVDPRDKKIVELEKQIARLEKRAARTEGLLELQKKVSEILGIDLDQTGEKN